MTDEIILEVHKLCKSYYSNPVLKDISFQMREGRFYALLGENGTGKSTLLKILMGVERPDSGQGLILGHSLLEANEKIKETIGLVSELIDFDVPLNMNEFFKVYNKLYPNWNQELFEKIVSDRKIDLKKKFRDYSRGQKMQLALLAALSISPKLLFIDEVTSVLDVYARKYFMNLLRQLTKQGCCIVLTTNIISEIQLVATDLLFLSEGRLQINSPIQEIPNNFLKLRKFPDTRHPIFEHDQCFWAGTNSDNTESFIIPRQLVMQVDCPEELIDRRKVQLDDIFIFYYNYKVEKGHEAVA